MTIKTSQACVAYFFCAFFKYWTRNLVENRPKDESCADSAQQRRSPNKSGRGESQRLSEVRQRTQTTPHREKSSKRPLSVKNVNFKVEHNFFKAFWSVIITKVDLCGGSKKFTEISFFQEIL